MCVCVLVFCWFVPRERAMETTLIWLVLRCVSSWSDSWSFRSASRRSSWWDFSLLCFHFILCSFCFLCKLSSDVTKKAKWWEQIRQGKEFLFDFCKQWQTWIHLDHCIWNHMLHAKLHCLSWIITWYLDL